MSKDPASDWCRVGTITGVHGIKGVLRFLKECETDEFLKPGKKLRRITEKGESDTVALQWVRPNGKIHLLSIEGISDRNQAASFVGSTLYVEQSSLPKLEEGTYYWFELIGLSVFTEDGAFIGKITEIIETGANDVYVVQGETRETLIPAIASVVKSLDIKAKTMHVDLPEGL